MTDDHHERDHYADALYRPKVRLWYWYNLVEMKIVAWGLERTGGYPDTLTPMPERLERLRQLRDWKLRRGA